MALTSIAALAFALAASCSSNEKAVGDSTTAAFRYREVYLPEGMGENARKLNLNTLEYDWGIWGHNLAKVLPENHSKSVYAKVNGNTSKKQFCFSSNHLYEYIEDFISSKYDDDEYARFAIVPNDNDIVCLCEKCVIAGNSYGNASPAVNKLVKRLAEKFPNHSFFTSDYRTTSALPKDTMPSNTGVLVSAINYPLTTGYTREEDVFLERINQWVPIVPRVLVWDYIDNFDDYFTPYPVLGTMQRRLQTYVDNGVTRIFLNGSGSDISALSDIRTQVLAAMTQDPYIDWKSLLREKASELYPVAGETIADFMIAQEEFVANSGAILPLYEGVQNALVTYLPENDFVAFQDKLVKLKESASDKEKLALNKLLGQLALTRLEINRINSDVKNSDQWLAALQGLLNSGVEGYNETGWSIASYIDDYKFLLDHYDETGKKNKLKGEKIVPLTALDPMYSDVSILTDGILGIPSNYHSGLLINSPAEYTQLAVPNKPGTKKLKVWLASNPPYRIFLPEMVTLMVNGEVIGKAYPTYPKDDSRHAAVEFDIPGNATGTFTLTFHKNPERHSMAIEEIVAL